MNECFWTELLEINDKIDSLQDEKLDNDFFWNENFSQDFLNRQIDAIQRHVCSWEEEYILDESERKEVLKAIIVFLESLWDDDSINIKTSIEFIESLWESLKKTERKEDDIWFYIGDNWFPFIWFISPEENKELSEAIEAIVNDTKLSDDEKFDKLSNLYREYAIAYKKWHFWNLAITWDKRTIEWIQNPETVITRALLSSDEYTSNDWKLKPEYIIKATFWDKLTPFIWEWEESQRIVEEKVAELSQLRSRWPKVLWAKLYLIIERDLSFLSLSPEDKKLAIEWELHDWVDYSWIIEDWLDIPEDLLLYANDKNVQETKNNIEWMISWIKDEETKQKITLLYTGIISFLDWSNYPLEYYLTVLNWLNETLNDELPEFRVAVFMSNMHWLASKLWNSSEMLKFLWKISNIISRKWKMLLTELANQFSPKEFAMYLATFIPLFWIWSMVSLFYNIQALSTWTSYITWDPVSSFDAKLNIWIDLVWLVVDLISWGFLWTPLRNMLKLSKWPWIEIIQKIIKKLNWAGIFEELKKLTDFENIMLLIEKIRWIIWDEVDNLISIFKRNNPVMAVS